MVARNNGHPRRHGYKPAPSTEPQRERYAAFVVILPGGSVFSGVTSVNAMNREIGPNSPIRPEITRLFDTHAEAEAASVAINKAVSHLYFPPADEPGPEGGA